MSVELNHTIILARDNRASATFLTELLGLEDGIEWGPFVAVALGNGVTLDYATAPTDDISPQHYALLVSEDVFDTAYAKIKDRGITHHGDPHGEHPGEINHNDGGRGVYFPDPAGHFMELLTVPYGGRPAAAAGN